MSGGAPALAILVAVLGHYMATGTAHAVGCPGTAAVLIACENSSADVGLTLHLEGDLLEEAATCDGDGATAYAVDVPCAGGESGRIRGLRPGRWANRIRVTVTGSAPQTQAKHAVFVGGSGTSNVLSWTVFPRTFVVEAPTPTALRTALDAAAAFTAANPGPALVTFSRTAFPPGRAMDHPVKLLERPACLLDDAQTCAPDGEKAGLCFTGSHVVVDGLDARGRGGAVALSVDTCGRRLLRLYGHDNVFRGLTFVGSRKPDPVQPNCQADTVVVTGASARRNRFEASDIIGPTCGDTVAIEDGAGAADEDGPADNVIARTVVRDGEDKGVKVSLGAHVLIEESCITGNRNGGVQATLGGHATVVQNVVERNVPGSAQNGLSATGNGTERTTLETDGNLIRFAGARGLSVVDDADARFANDFVGDNQFVGARVETTSATRRASATFSGVTLACNHNAGVSGTCRPQPGGQSVPCLVDTDCCGIEGTCCASDPECAAPLRCRPPTSMGFGLVLAQCPLCPAPDVDLGTPSLPGANAVTVNPQAPEGVNIDVGLPGVTVPADGNQWEHCGPGPGCDTASILAKDVRLAADAALALGTPEGARAGTPVLLHVTPRRPAKGDLVRVFGVGFNAVDGIACAGATVPTAACSGAHPALADRNRSDAHGNRLSLRSGSETISVDVDAVTPTMLVFRMPVDCHGAMAVTVARLDADDVLRTDTIALCDPSGCDGEPASTLCDDGDACTVGDHCAGDRPVCLAGTPRACGGACLTGACDPTVGCVPQPFTAACDDGDACTVGDRCRGDGDVCVPGLPRMCAGACLTGACNPATGCAPNPPDRACEDGDVCTVGDHCAGDRDVCVAGPPARCDDGDACTDDSCGATGCLHTAETGVEAVLCLFTDSMLDPAECAEADVPVKVDRHVAQARTLVERAAPLTVGRRRNKLLARGQGATRKALRVVAQASRRGGIPVVCGDALKTVVRTLQARIADFADERRKRGQARRAPLP